MHLAIHPARSGVPAHSKALLGHHGEPHKPGHLRKSSWLNLALATKERPACVLCDKPFQGTPNQKLCGECRQSEIGKEYLAGRKVQSTTKSRKHKSQEQKYVEMRERMAKLKAKGMLA